MRPRHLMRTAVLTSAMPLLGLLVVPLAPPAAGLAEVAPAAARPAAGCPTAPAYQNNGAKFGVHLSTGSTSFADAFKASERTFSEMPIVRVFDGNVPPADAWTNRAPVLDGTPVVTSFRMPPGRVLKGVFDSRLTAFFRDAPSQPIFWSYFHEPEKEIDVNRTFSARKFRRAFQHVARLAAAVCRPNLFPTLILTAWTTNPVSGRDWRDYYPGDRFVSVLAFDPYNNANGKPTSYPRPATVFASVVQAARASGKPWGVAEIGSGLVRGDAGQGRARWLTRTGRYFKSHGVSFVCYFNSRIDAVDFRLLDRPSIRAWRALIRG